MLKMLGIGFGILTAALIAFSFFGDSHPQQSASAVKPIDRAFASCKEWTRSNSKLPVGEFVWVEEIKGAKVPQNHHMLEYDYRAKDSGVLMQTRCEYLEDGSVVSAHSSLK